jgi:TonB family protein
MQDILRAPGGPKSTEASLLLKEFVLPNHHVWMRDTFGEKIGARFAAVYEEQRERLPALLADSLAHKLAGGLTRIDVQEWNRSYVEGIKEPEGRAYFVRLTKSMRLYQVRFLEGNKDKGKMVRYFTFVDGAFRFVSFVLPAEPPAPPRGVLIPKGRPRVEGKVQAAKLVKSVEPKYPPEAKNAGVRGTVRLRGVVTREGVIDQAEVITGHPLLAAAAVEAVMRWRYQPALLNNQPVEVNITIDVDFTPR